MPSFEDFNSKPQKPASTEGEIDMGKIRATAQEIDRRNAARLEEDRINNEPGKPTSTGGEIDTEKNKKKILKEEEIMARNYSSTKKSIAKVFNSLPEEYRLEIQRKKEEAKIKREKRKEEESKLSTAPKNTTKSVKGQRIKDEQKNFFRKLDNRQ